MLKIILIFFIVFNAYVFADQSDYLIERGKLHNGGNATLVDLDNEENGFFTIKINYEIIKKKLAPIPEDQLKGESEIIFPSEFRTEVGYQNLEKVKSMEIKGTVIEFQKRVDIGVLKNGYEVIVYPRNKRSKILFYYHPELNHLGWKEVSIILINKLPVLNGYEIKLTQK